MSDALALILEEATQWLEQQPLPEKGSAECYAHHNFRIFLASISDDADLPALERACSIIRHCIMDQFEWDSAYSEIIGAYVDRVERFAKEQAGRRL
jgi:hypothetical protein